jgi:lipopolysaccharide transport system permease protein
MLGIVGAAVGPAQELRQSMKLWPLWTFMSWQDIRQRYRGSLLGPFWVAGGVAAASLGAGILYSRVLRVDGRELVPFVAVGIALWSLVSLTLIEACHSFTASWSLIRNAALPRPVHILRTVWRNLIVFAHSIPVVGLMLWVNGRALGPEAWLAALGMLLLMINLLWSSWVVALLSARFRDVIQLVTYGLQFVAFVTPIFWYPDLAGRHFGMLRFNPFYHWLEIVRAPLLGHAPSFENWAVSGGMAVFGSILALLSFRRFRNAIAFWV